MLAISTAFDIIAALEQLPALASRGPLGAGEGRWQALR
jgi:hypothetical protein